LPEILTGRAAYLEARLEDPVAEGITAVKLAPLASIQVLVPDRRIQKIGAAMGDVNP
jgi:hypothetical protein